MMKNKQTRAASSFFISCIAKMDKFLVVVRVHMILKLQFTLPSNFFK